MSRQACRCNSDAYGAPLIGTDEPNHPCSDFASAVEFGTNGLRRVSAEVAEPICSDQDGHRVAVDFTLAIASESHLVANTDLIHQAARAHFGLGNTMFRGARCHL